MKSFLLLVMQDKHRKKQKMFQELSLGSNSNKVPRSCNKMMDFVSSLPDEILGHILSFLPTKPAVVTSSLAKRWVNVWKLVPNLDIDDSVFLHPEDDKDEREDIRQSFVGFVDSVLALQGDSPVKKFSLKCITGVDPNDVYRWICNVVQRGVSDLDLFIDFGGDEYNLPMDIFDSRTLVKLKFRSYDWWWEKKGVPYLPLLRSLCIDTNFFYDEIERFLPSYPALEELQMANIEWKDDNIIVSSESLRKLTLRSSGYERLKEVVENPKSISFHTPNLVSLTYMILVAEDYPLVNMEKLSVAHINLKLLKEQIERIRVPSSVWLEDGEDNVVLRFGNVVKLMNGIRNVQKLYLQSDTLEVLSLCCNTMPVFNNLRFLCITSAKDRGWQAMPVLLRNCPHLETITFKGLLHHVTDKCGDACPCITREEKGCSMTSCPVKLIEIQGFRGTMKEMHMIQHFMEYFPCLKEMKVYIEENEPTRLNNPEIAALVTEIFNSYNKLSSCNLQLMGVNYLDPKWIAQGI